MSAEPGWIEPPDLTLEAEYWVTRRSADAAAEWKLDLPDIRERYRWVPDSRAWITGYYEGTKGRCANLGLLHSNNGWRIERICEEGEPS